MRILQFDSTGGASGDMTLAALFDLGVSPDLVRAELAKLDVGEYRIEVQPADQNGMHGTRVDVHTEEHDHDHHGHHAHRAFSDIRRMIESSGLAGGAKGRALSVFQRLAEAEALVHRTAVDEVRFHEVGAVDSIVDIVGACVALESLGVAGVAVGPLPAGYGTAHSAHGVLPIPAPATVELLKGMPVVQTDEPFELVTPTGAALLSTWKTLDAPPPGSRMLAVGYGFGRRKLNSRPNLLRACLLDAPEAAAEGAGCLVMECNIDDMAPELVGALVPRLLDAGALDAFVTPVQMKKQRPGVLLTVLCRPGSRALVLDVLFAESTTFGVREYDVRRTELDRRHVAVATPYGSVRVKIGSRGGRDVTRSPEYEDCRALADQQGVPLRAVYEAAAAAAHGLR